MANQDHRSVDGPYPSGYRFCIGSQPSKRIRNSHDGMAVPFQLSDYATEPRCISKCPMHQNNCSTGQVPRPDPASHSHPWLRHNSSFQTRSHLSPGISPAPHPYSLVYVGPPRNDPAMNDTGRRARDLLDHGVGRMHGYRQGCRAGCPRRRTAVPAGEVRDDLAGVVNAVVIADHQNHRARGSARSTWSSRAMKSAAQRRPSRYTHTRCSPRPPQHGELAVRARGEGPRRGPGSVQLARTCGSKFRCDSSSASTTARRQRGQPARDARHHLVVSRVAAGGQLRPPPDRNRSGSVTGSVNSPPATRRGLVLARPVNGAVPPRTFGGRAAILSSCMTGTVSSPSPRRRSWDWRRPCGPARGIRPKRLGRADRRLHHQLPTLRRPAVGGLGGSGCLGGGSVAWTHLCPAGGGRGR
jgi:hypothetical protein